MATKHGLGRGLGALIQEVPMESAPPSAGGLTRVPLGTIRPNPWQPRRQFAPEALQELVSSIRERGVLQPLLVRRAGDSFELIAGERRLRAAGEAGLADVPVRVMEVTDAEALELALIENLQRQDLNAVEEAEGYKMLVDRFSLTQDEVAQRVGKARVSVTNALRLLGLPDRVKGMLVEGSLTVGHAKVLLGVAIPQEQSLLADRVTRESLSVRDLERIIERSQRVPRKPRNLRDDIPASHVAYLSDRLHQHFGTAVRLQPCRTLANGKKLKGSVEIEFYSNEDLDRILSLLGVAGTE